MNKTLIFLIIAISILVLNAIVVCVSPIINNIEVPSTITGNRDWRPADWKNLNCQFLADKIKEENIGLDDFQKYKKYKNLCYRQKAMYGLENSAFIINIILAFVCADLTLLHYLNVGKSFEKKTGLIGLISGIIGFILTLAYCCYSGYIFNNDIAYGILDLSSTTPFFIRPNSLVKLFPNGAIYKKEGNNRITVDQKETGENAKFVLYKDLGKKQYNYNSKIYQTYYKIEIPYSPPSPPAESSMTCRSIEASESYNDDCEYIYNTPETNVINKYIHDRWITALIIAIIIVVCDLGLSIFGFLLFKSNEDSAPLSEQTPIIYKK